MSRRLVRATALFMIVSWAWFAPLQTLAQLSGLIVNITSPANGATVSGTVTVTASVTIIGALTVDSVQFKLDGVNLGSADTSAPYSIPWNTITASNGSHTLTAVARDQLGIQYTSSPVTVTVSNDTTPPAVTLTAPTNGATVSGTINVTATASDNVGVVGVQFKLDGANLGAEDTSAPYAVSWSTTTASNGSHTLTAVARDAAGNNGTAAVVTVTVFNDTAPPTVAITAPANGATVSGTISVTASASDNVGVVGVQFKLDGANLGTEDTTSPYSRTWDTTIASNGSHTLTAVARDATGNQATSTSVTVTVFNDTAPPTVAITAPANGATVSGTITVSATASDNVRVVGVQFKLDGANLGTEDTTAPYSRSWNTTTTSNGTHTLTAVARDAAGNSTTAATITVTVSNDTSPPTVSLTAPANGATVSGTITVSANASDNVGVVGVQFKLDGANLDAEDPTAPYAVSWDTTTASNGSHTLTAVARDAAGNTRTSTAVTVTVSNGPPPDTTPPTVSLTAPANGATVSGSTPVNATAEDNVGVVGVQFFLDGANLGTEDTTAPYAVTWDTTTTADGTHTLSAVARDASGNTGTAATITVTVSNGPPPDTTPPTVSLTAPANGATVSGTINVTANAADNVGVVGVQFQLDGANLSAEDPTAPYAISWDTTTVSNGSHTLTAVARDAAGNSGTSTAVTVTVSNGSVSGGDVFLAFANDGRVQWYNPDGSLRQILIGSSIGQASSLAFDAARNLYVPHWSNQGPGNLVDRFDPNGNHLGTFGSGYNCNPSSITFDAAGNMYVGHADCTGDIMKFNSAGTLVASFDVLTTNRGTDHIDLASDGCTMFYTSRDVNVYRFNVCTNTQLLPFNTQPLPGDIAYHVRALPDGGVLVADGTRLVRLDAAGNLVPTVYFAPGESNYWGGVDHMGDGTFWASNAMTDKAYKFDLQTGAILATITPGTSGFTLAGLAVRP